MGCDYRVFRHIFADYGTCADHAATADMHAILHDDACAYPDIIFDDNRALRIHLLLHHGRVTIVDAVAEQLDSALTEAVHDRSLADLVDAATAPSEGDEV